MAILSVNGALCRAFRLSRAGPVLSGRALFKNQSCSVLPYFVEANRIAIGSRICVTCAHVEEARTPYLDYKVETKYQPDEHVLELGRGELLELDEALKHMKAPKRLAFRDFTIWPMP